MTVERRSTVVTLYTGNYGKRLADLVDVTMSKQRASEVAEGEEARKGPRRAGQAPESKGLAAEARAAAKEHDDLVEEADATATKIPVFELSYLHWKQLKANHPPRPEVRRDVEAALNFETLPADLLCASLVPADDAAKIRSIDDLVTSGAVILEGLGAISAVQYAKLEKGAWGINVEDDDFPKVSLSWLLMQASESEAEPPDAQE